MLLKKGAIKSMKTIKPHVKDVIFFEPDNGDSPEELIERIGRTCYQSEDRISQGTANTFVKMLMNRGHYAMLEFGYAVVVIVADRGFTHELVRHRIASFAQESTRWCNYTKGKFGEEITVIEQPGMFPFTTRTGMEIVDTWTEAMDFAEHSYFRLIKLGVPSQVARSVLPIGLKAEIVIGTNLREWKYILKLRSGKDVHPIMRWIMVELSDYFKRFCPVMFGDI